MEGSGRVVPSGSAAGDLGRAEELIQTRPGEAVRLAETHFASPEPTEAFAAHRIAGYALRELQDLAGSTYHFECAHNLADDAATRARISLSLVGNLTLVGEFDEAHRRLDRLAESGALGDDQYLVAIQRASIFNIEDRLADAVDVSHELLAEQPDLDPSLRAHVLTNLGTSLNQLGRFTEARTVLTEALDVYERLGESRPQLEVLANLGLCEAWTLHIPEALAVFERSRRLGAEIGVEDAIGMLDEARAMVEAGLGREACAAAESALARIEQGGATAWSGEAHLIRANALLILDRPADAAAAARDALTAFERQGRVASAVLAQKVCCLARVTDPTLSFTEIDVDAVTANVAKLVELDYRVEAQELDLKLAIAAYEAEEDDAARAACARCLSGPEETPASQLRRCVAAGVIAMLDHDDDRALATFAHGADVLETHRLSLGATELRARASRLGGDLSRLALRAAMRTGDPAVIWRWSERQRANTLELLPSETGDDAELIEAIAAVRSSAGAVRSGRDADGHEAAQARLLMLLRTRRATNGPTTGDRSDAEVEPLPDSSLFVEHDDRLHRLDVDGAGDISVSAELAEVAEIDDLVGAVGRAWRRTLRVPTTSTTTSLLSAIGALDDALGVRPRSGRYSIGASERLHAVPWSAMPSLAGVDVAVAPSTAVLARPPSPRGSGVAVAVGPALDHAHAEAEAIGSVWSASTLLGATGSSIDATLDAISGRRVAHFAAHGAFRPDNPMFSSIELHEGPLTVIDLERLSTPPSIAVLSACDVGRSAVFEGNETLGLVTALLSAGCGSVIAPVFAISDERSVLVMTELHRNLASGMTPRRALRRTVDGFEVGSPEWSLAASFVCFGSG